ncbi:extracellular serine-rich protein [Rhexocercosporidium sp. MPI-PUGE-AT-0058]|nr:extracellular serine-rich protein [Rhexocercosporidium sp. MPI-PUGE-AT-0058]
MKFFFFSGFFAATSCALPNSFNTLTATGGLVVPRANQLIPVVVGGPQDTFAPNSVVAALGDVIQFQFSNGNHTATQSTPEAPCTPLAGGVSSGHIPFQDGQTEVGTFNMPVTSVAPMFIYCATGPHCQEGQVMIINPGNAQQLVDFVKAAQGTTASVDSTVIAGGTAGKVTLGTAAFIPAPPEAAPVAAPAAAPAPAPAAPAA